MLTDAFTNDSLARSNFTELQKHKSYSRVATTSYPISRDLRLTTAPLYGMVIHSALIQLD
jgi:hypothetical protein